MKMTVGEFKEQLSGYPDDWDLEFNGLDFYHLKIRGEKLINVEFNEILYREKSGEVSVIDNVE